MQAQAACLALRGICPLQGARYVGRLGDSLVWGRFVDRIRDLLSSLDF